MKKTTTLISILALCFLRFSSFGQTNVSADISSNQTWDVSGSPYQIGSYLNVLPDVTLTILPGVIVESTSNSEIKVQGEIQVLGNADSIVEFNNVRLKLLENADPYNPGNQSGALFNFVKFSNATSYEYAFTNNSKGCCIKNSTFLLGGKGFHSTIDVQDSTYLEVTNCDFVGLSSNLTHSVLFHGILTKNMITNCSFNNVTSVAFLNGNGVIKENSFDSLTGVSFDTDEGYDIDCNEFSKIAHGVRLYPRGGIMNFRHNSLDSCGVISQYDTYAMLTIRTDSVLMNGAGMLQVSSNNLLNQVGQYEKVRFTQYSTLTGFSMNVNLTQNFWQTTDSNVIGDMIIDASVDSAIESTADYSSYLSNLDTLCFNQNSATISKVESKVIGVYPNPVSNVLYINNGVYAIAGAYVIGIDGSVIMELNDGGLESIDVSDLTPGLYYLILNDEQGQELRAKFVKF